MTNADANPRRCFVIGHLALRLRRKLRWSQIVTTSASCKFSPRARARAPDAGASASDRGPGPVAAAAPRPPRRRRAPQSASLAGVKGDMRGSFSRSEEEPRTSPILAVPPLTLVPRRGFGGSKNGYGTTTAHALVLSVLGRTSISTVGQGRSRTETGGRCCIPPRDYTQGRTPWAGRARGASRPRLA